ncbi:MAG: ABC transporter ATP-binding protein [Kouleothrix sp.]|jgi:ABC-2 type transport system ATP-binding protein|nr:ABC transporter ATP-binding protein [Kouleothrix sp.]
MQPAIEAHALTKRFRKLHTYRDLVLYPWRKADHLAVDQVSLEIARGELFGLLGQNGAGKTTLIKMLCTALIPSAGQAHVASYDVVRQARQVRERIGLVSGEERSFYWRLTGRQNLEFFAALYHVPGALARQRIDELLRRVGMADHGDRPFRTYSSGMRQKLAIARGLLNSPQVLFMDEPTRSLDPISAQAMRRFVAEYIIGELGCTVILATHSMAEAEELCDRLALIQSGRIVAQGTIAQLRQGLRYGTRCELRLRHMQPELPGSLRRLPGILDVAAARDEAGHLLALTLAEEGPVLAAVLREVVESGADIHQFVTRQVTLEEIYLHTLSQPPAPAEEVRA